MVKITLVMRGRELAHVELGYQQMTKFKEMVADAATVQEGPKRQGNNIILLLAPL